MIELEKTFLVKYLPKGYENSPKKEITDVYFPVTAVHPTLRLRKSGDKYEMTKKTPVSTDSSSAQIEDTIKLTVDEAKAIRRAPGKISDKVRYYFPIGKDTAEITIFRGDLTGLVLVDFEFDTKEAMEEFQMPEFCLEDVTEEEWCAGGMLCGKSYSGIEIFLKKYNYKKIVTDIK